MKKNNIRITAIVTSYNRPDLLEKSLLSLRLQPEGPDEVVIADDGSRPEVIKAMRLLIAGFPVRAAIVTQKDIGFRLARARNNGARIATGDYLYFTDQDLVFSTGFFPTLRAAIARGEFTCAYAVRFDEAQSAAVTPDRVRSGEFLHAATPGQLSEMKAQYRKDAIYRLLYKIHLRSRGPKLRGYGFGVWRDDYLRVNGFDENYTGWGFEDDDFCRRLYASGLAGRNISRSQFAVHLHHPANNAGNDSRNRAYYSARIPEIRRGGFYCQWGIATPAEDPPAAGEQ